ncbi:unnamed protein product [Clonostachys solani]|uniref:Uncharacterized protein n=1 Tax=Clonostachys solani TaxID=160281 RepID=A0A9N9Z7E7_9HYPO|nr:unnamed protein product [Clonostachys solani]
MYAPPEKPVLVSQAFDAHVPIIKDSAARASSEANTRRFSAPATRGLASEDSASTARVSATEATSSRAVLIEKRTDNQINAAHRKAYVFATTSAAAPGVVTGAAVTTLWIVGYIYDFEREFDTDYTSSSNSSSTSSRSLSFTGSYHSSSSGTSSASDSGSSSSSGLDTDSSLSSESDTDDSSSSGSDDDSSSDSDSRLLSNWEISENVFDTDMHVLDLEELVGFSGPGVSKITTAGMTMVRLVGITADIVITRYNDGSQDKHEDQDDKEGDDNDDMLLRN